jgi:hypothetical protein
MNPWSVSRRRFLEEIGALAGVRVSGLSLPFASSACGLGSQDRTYNPGLTLFHEPQTKKRQSVGQAARHVNAT